MNVSLRPSFPFLIPSFYLTQVWEQASTYEDLHLKISTKWYQKSDTLNATFRVIQQATLIGYSSAEKCDTTEFKEHNLHLTKCFNQNTMVSFLSLSPKFYWVETNFL